MEEGSVHTHGDTCYEARSVPVCGLEPSQGHTHSESCYAPEMALTCGEEEWEAHTHYENCYASDGTLTCTLPEGEGHTHGDGCYSPTGETTLACGMEQTDGHVHTDECYETEELLTCTLDGQTPHTHTEECYEDILACDREEHAHVLACQSNPESVETPEIWEDTLPRELTGVWADDLLSVAASQIGCEEREDNFAVAEDGVTVTGSYTRYGAWYGLPYEPWSAMFVSFCLNYAGIPQEAFPRESDAERWVEKLSGIAEGYSAFRLIRQPQEYTPVPGDLVFDGVK